VNPAVQMVSTARYYQLAKNGVHALQALLVFIGAAITIAVFTKEGQSDGRITYYFVLVSSLCTGSVYDSVLTFGVIVLALHTSPGLSNGFSHFRANETLCKPLHSRPDRYYLHRLVAFCLHCAHSMGQARVSCCKRLEWQRGQSL